MGKSEKEKRIYLTLENQKEIVRAFFVEWKGKDFGRQEFKEFLTKNYDWFAKANQSIQTSRLENLISVMKSMYGKKLERVYGGQPGVKSTWLLPIVATEIIPEAEEKPKLKRKAKSEKPNKRHCSVERIKAFYNVVRAASKPLGGITKSDLATIMGYKNKSMASQGIESLNNLFKLETGLRPLTVNKDHTFINVDIIHVERDEAELIMEDLLEKLKGVEPEEPKGLMYESIVKPIVRSDYYTLKMFEGKSRLEYRNSDAMLFRKGVIGDCSITITGNSNSMECVVRSFVEPLLNRYEIEIEIDVKPYQYIQLVSSQDDLKEALKKIEDKFAEFFCEDIVPHERTVLAAEIKKETKPDVVESDMITIVEDLLFKKKSGSLFISKIWEELDKRHIERHWDILAVLRKCPRFSVINVSGESGIEPCVIYTEPEPISDETTNKKEANEDLLSKEEVIEIEDDFKPSIKKNESSTTEIYFGFRNEGDLIEICQKTSSCEQIEDDGDYHMCVFYAKDDMDKKTMLLLLKLCYMATASEKVKMIYHNKNLLIKKLEYDLLN